MKKLQLDMMFIIVLMIILNKVLSIPERVEYPQIIAHRGASGYVPEHSLQAYQLAIDMLTDYIEPDLCLSKDGIFVALHDLLLDDVTNVNDIDKFKDRKTTKIVDGQEMTGYFVSDFLYNELLELRLNQRLSYRTTLYNGKFQMPSLNEIINLVHNSYNNTNRLVGLYIELKHPNYFKDLGYNMADMLLKELEVNGFEIKGHFNITNIIPCIIQCFDAKTLIYLNDKTDIPLIQLLNPPQSNSTIDYYWSDEKLIAISNYADGIGPEKTYFISQSIIKAKDAIMRAHNYGLFIHPWTFREDNGIGNIFDNNFQKELDYYYCCLGMDALFSEFPDMNREVIQRNKFTGHCSYSCHMKS